MSEIYAALAKVAGEVGIVGKTRKNQAQGYQFRGIDDVLSAVQELQARHGVVVVPRVVERERELVTTAKGGTMTSVRLVVDHHFYAADGSSVVATTIGEATDSGDKASNKAMSAALKYALVETYCIPTYERDRDTEESSPEVTGPAPRVAAPPPRPAPSAPAVPGVVELGLLLTTAKTEAEVRAASSTIAKHAPKLRREDLDHLRKLVASQLLKLTAPPEPGAGG